MTSCFIASPGKRGASAWLDATASCLAPYLSSASDIFFSSAVASHGYRGASCCSTSPTDCQ